MIVFNFIVYFISVILLHEVIITVNDKNFCKCCFSKNKRRNRDKLNYIM